MMCTFNIPKRGQKPTNGDMIKALYPNASFVEVEYVLIIRMYVGDFYVDFNKE